MSATAEAAPILFVAKQQLVDLFTAMDFQHAAKWDEKKIKSFVNTKLANYIENEGEESLPADPDAIALLEQILETLDAEGQVLLEGDDPAVENAPPVKRGRGRPKKEKTPEEPKEPQFQVDHKYTWTKTSKKSLKMNKALALKYRDMEACPNDRDIQKARLTDLRRAVERGEFWGATWAEATCKETGKTYRVNGKHTSNVLSEFYEQNKPVPDVDVWVIEFECPTLEDVAGLYATFDTKRQTRSKNDVLKTFAASSDVVKDLSPKMLSVLTSGIAFAHWETTYRRQDTKDQAHLMLEHEDFAKWYVKLFDEADEDTSTKHILRAGCVAAMLKTWQKDKKAATEYWDKLRDDCDDPRGSPVRKLFRWLLEAKVGAVKDAKKSVSDREVYLQCLCTWNAYRGEKEQRVSVDMKTPELV